MQYIPCMLWFWQIIRLPRNNFRSSRATCRLNVHRLGRNLHASNQRWNTCYRSYFMNEHFSSVSNSYTEYVVSEWRTARQCQRWKHYHWRHHEYVPAAWLTCELSSFTCLPRVRNTYAVPDKTKWNLPRRSCWLKPASRMPYVNQISSPDRPRGLVHRQTYHRSKVTMMQNDTC